MQRRNHEEKIIIMFKNKKSKTESLEALIRIMFFVVILLLIVFPAGEKIKAAFFNSEKKYLQSFQNFVDNINKMSLGRQTFELKLKEKSAIIGFSKNGDRYECFGCYNGDYPTVIFNKPKNEECTGNACICLCSLDFKLTYSDIDGKKTEVGQCPKLICKKIEQHDIVDKVMIKTKDDTGINIVITTIWGNEWYWKNGFLFENGLNAKDIGANGLKMNNNEINTFIVEKTSKLISVCSPDMMKFNKDKFNFDGCLITDYNSLKK